MANQRRVANSPPVIANSSPFVANFHLVDTHRTLTLEVTGNGPLVLDFISSYL